MSDLFYWKAFPHSSTNSNVPSRQTMLDYQEQIFNKFFDDFFGNRKNFNVSNTSYPKMDIVETKDYLQINCSVPGVYEDNLDIETEKETRILTIKGKSYIFYDSDFQVHLKELKLSAFARTVKLPDYVDLDKCEAKLNDGILSINFPKLKLIEEEKPQTIKKISVKKN